MADQSAFARWGRHLVAAILAVVISWFAFVANREVPILDLFDLGIHEVGHLLFAFAPRMLMFLAGSAAQVIVPLALAWYFGITRRDAAGGGFCLAWAGASMWDVSVYIADAPVQALPLIGGGQHDWAFLLGSQGWGVMHLSDEIARFVEFSGGVIAIVGITIAVWAALHGLRRPRTIVRPVATPMRAPGERDPWLAAADLPFVHKRAAGSRSDRR
jgi:hypothetical protein